MDMNLRIRKLHDVILPEAEGSVTERELDEEQNAEAFATLVQCLDDRSLSLIIRDAKDDETRAVKILREHYLSQGKPRVIALYTELTSLVKKREETVTDYVIRAETASALLKSIDESISESLLIAMVLKGLPTDFKPFSTVITQREKQMSFSEFKVALRNYEDTEKLCSSMENDNVLKVSQSSGNHRSIVCFDCGQPGHKRGSPMCSQRRVRKKRWCNICKNNIYVSSVLIDSVF